MLNFSFWGETQSFKIPISGYLRKAPVAIYKEGIGILIIGDCGYWIVLCRTSNSSWILDYTN
jgi:hypothetical protein